MKIAPTLNRFGRTIGQNRILLLLLGAELALCSLVALSMAGTFDEHCHWLYGKNVLLGHTERSSSEFDSKSPLTALNALPIALGRQFQDVYHFNIAPVKALADERSGRFVTIAFLLLLTWLLYRWTLELYGRQAALAAVVLCIIEPNLIAHGTLNTTDLYATLAIVAACYAAWRFVRSPDVRRALMAAAALGAALLTKFLALYLFPILLVTVALAAIAGGRQGGMVALRPRLLALYVVAAGVCSLLFLNLGYEFRGTFTPLSGYAFESNIFRGLQNVSLLARVPLPLPTPFLQGLDMTRNHEQTGKNFGNIYLLGEVRDPKDPNTRPFPAYYLVAYAVKEPIALQILFLASVLMVCRRPGWRRFFHDEAFLLFPAAAIFLILSFLNRAQIGIRHILPCLGLLLPLCASCFANWSTMSFRRRAALGALTGYAAVSVLSYAPHMIPYMNELVWDKKNSFRVLADSNLDWHQNSWVLGEYLRQHPDVALEPGHPTTGRVAVSANLLTGVQAGNFNWLRQQCRPVGHIAYAHVICKVEPTPTLAGVSRR